MGYVILLAGASGAIGRQQVPLLCGADHQVIGTTRSEEKFASLRALGADPVAVDACDAKGLSQVARSVQPQIHPSTEGLAYGPRAGPDGGSNRAKCFAMKAPAICSPLPLRPVPAVWWPKHRVGLRAGTRAASGE
jgi:NADPH:quinone reductase-like Zn-dependent oxidoreductase